MQAFLVACGYPRNLRPSIGATRDSLQEFKGVYLAASLPLILIVIKPLLIYINIYYLIYQLQNYFNAYNRKNNWGVAMVIRKGPILNMTDGQPPAGKGV
jgi:hypothetical protein